MTSSSNSTRPRNRQVSHEKSDHMSAILRPTKISHQTFQHFGVFGRDRRDSNTRGIYRPGRFPSPKIGTGVCVALQRNARKVAVSITRGPQTVAVCFRRIGKKSEKLWRGGLPFREFREASIANLRFSWKRLSVLQCPLCAGHRSEDRAVEVCVRGCPKGASRTKS
jgi:hypothetical protein